MRGSLLSSGALLGAAAAWECSPAAIQSALPANVSVNFAYTVPANGTFQVPAGDLGWPANPVGLPALCAVSGQVQSIGNSTFGFGLFLPDDWNGRFLAVGNGAFGGGINWQDMGPGSRYGFATMSTDTGHNSSLLDGSWAYNSPEKQANWGYLAMHGSVVAAKAITAAYYAKDISYNYYAGCSTGGRQGLKEAEAYPDDFDGIVAGAPAWWTSHLQPWTVKVALYNLPPSADYHIPSALYPAIAKEVMKQCDPQDGLKDGIISDPEGCNIRYEALLCGANVTNATAAGCLTAPQLDTLYKIHTDSIGDNQTYLFPHLELGSEPSWNTLLSPTNKPNALGGDYPKYFLGLGPDWDFYTYNEDVQRLADELDPGNATVGFDLSGFHAKGGKVLTYHGLSDGSIPTGSTPYHYNHVVRELQPRGINVDEFYRTFLVPGMNHCSGTPVNAPWYFAGPNQALVLGGTVHSTPGFENKEHDVLLAMMAWVEEGVAPDQVIGTKYVNDTVHTDVLRQRPLCMYPKMAKYTGKGDADCAENWECRLPY